MKLDSKQIEKVSGVARTYIESEKNPFFAQQVVNALDERAFDQLYDRFYTTLSFGTAGMRGIIGGGTNRINPYMIQKVTQGFANYLNSVEKNPTVTIAFDSRNYSKEFALQAALTLCANNITTYLYSEIRPVPMASFAIQALKTTAGIVITASHNPPQYNGYKVYWGDGGQVTSPHDIGIANSVALVNREDIKSIDEESARSKGLLKSVEESIDERYFQMVEESLTQKNVFETEKIVVAYTPLHGSGLIPITTLFKRLGIEYKVVAEQESPNGDFPTVSMPNPEDPQAMRLAIELAKEIKADIVLGTDPDADRLGIAIPTTSTKEDYHLLSGNEIAVLLCDYLLNQYRGDKIAVVVKSLVTTDLIKKITEAHNGVCLDVLTGFKYIAEKMVKFENSETHQFLFGCEESFGYNSLAAIRDKDAVSSAILAVEMIGHYISKGLSLQERLEQISQEYGHYAESVLSYTFEGAIGKEKMDQIMKKFRSFEVGSSFGGVKIVKKHDLLEPKEGEFPLSDVIILTFENRDKMVIRPSGTEPKIKYYLFFQKEGGSGASFEEQVQQKIQNYKAQL